MGGRKDLITAGLTLGALADAEAKAKGKMSAIIATESGSAVSFTSADAAPVADLTAAIVPVQSGSGDPYPPGGGKNKFDASSVVWKKWNLDSNAFKPVSDSSTVVNYTVNSDGSISITTTVAYYGICCEIEAVDYDRVASFREAIGGAIQLWSGYEEGATRISSGSTSCSIPANTSGYLAIRVDSAATKTAYVQLESGNTATAYAPYSNIRPISGWTECKVYRSGADTSDPTIYIVTFGSAGTVYGWTLDVTTGTLTVDRAIAIFDGSNDEAWTAYPSFNGFSIEYRNMNKGMRQDGISNWLKKDTGTHGSFGMWLGVNNNLIYAIEVAGALETYDLASWKSYLSANPLQVVYPLATPIVYNLTPVEIRTLVGQNTIWADTGEVTVMYAADTKAFIDNYIAARRNG